LSSLNQNIIDFLIRCLLWIFLPLLLIIFFIYIIELDIEGIEIEQPDRE